MTAVLFVVAVGLGVLVGVWLTSTVLGLWASTKAGRRRMALVEAENRVRDAQTVALNRLADVAASAIYDQTTIAPAQWPSQRAGGDVDARGDR